MSTTCIKAADSWGGPPTYCACAKCQEKRDAERAVLEAAEKWFKLNVMTGMPSEETIKIIEAKGVFVSAVDRAMAVAVARMLKAREPATTAPAATEYNWFCAVCDTKSKQSTAVPKEDRKCPCGAPCTLKARGGK